MMCDAMNNNAQLNTYHCEVDSEHSDPKPSDVFDVLAHTDELLIIQTNAGQWLDSEDKNSFGQFNVGLHVHDEPKQVLDNRAQLLSLINQYLAQAQSVGIKGQHINSIYWLNQVHSNHVVAVGNERKPNSRAKATIHTKQLSLVPPSADAQVTKETGTALAIMTADCVPIALYDKAGKQVAAIHAGWQGLANGVIAATYDALMQFADLNDDEPNPVQAWIGVCISQQCYEVSTDVVNKLLAGCGDMGMDIETVREQIVGHHDDSDKAWLDLPLLAQIQLESLGAEVMPHMLTNTLNAGFGQIKSDSPAYDCSYSNQRYYSYRRMTHLSESSTGRMALLVMRLGND